MEIRNNDILRISEQLFSSSNSYQTPFYNRISSMEDAKNLLEEGKEGNDPLIVSYPLGTGKSFFIEQISNDYANIGENLKPLYIRDITEKELKKWPYEILFVDECDIKTPWKTLVEGMKCITVYIKETKHQSVIVGDYCLRNQDLSGLLPKARFLNQFEPVNKQFLEGIIQDRLKIFLKRDSVDDSIITDELYDVLTPDDIVESISFRMVLSTLEKIARRLPANNDPCRITLEMAMSWVDEEWDPPITTKRQEDFLNKLLDFIGEEHPRGKGLRGGWSTKTLYQVGRDIGFNDSDGFYREIIEPLTRGDILVAAGIPRLDENGEFLRRPEPFYPSIPLILFAEK